MNPSFDDIRQRIDRRYRRLSWFVFHVIMAITSIIVIWLIDPTPQDGTPVIAGLWFGVLIFHAAKLFIDSRQDRAVERAWARYLDVVPDEKPKRTLRLTDDAEMEWIEDGSVEMKHEKRESKRG